MEVVKQNKTANGAMNSALVQVQKKKLLISNYEFKAMEVQKTPAVAGNEMLSVIRNLPHEGKAVARLRRCVGGSFLSDF